MQTNWPQLNFWKHVTSCNLCEKGLTYDGITITVFDAGVFCERGLTYYDKYQKQPREGGP